MNQFPNFSSKQFGVKSQFSFLTHPISMLLSIPQHFGDFATFGILVKGWGQKRCFGQTVCKVIWGLPLHTLPRRVSAAGEVCGALRPPGVQRHCGHRHHVVQPVALEVHGGGEGGVPAPPARVKAHGMPWQFFSRVCVEKWKGPL